MRLGGDAFFGQAGVEDGVSVGFWRAVLEDTGAGRIKVGGFVDATLGALGYQDWRGRGGGGAGEDFGEGKLVRSRRSQVV